MKYAVIKTGGKQYRVSEGEILNVENLGQESSDVVFSEVLLLVDGDSVELGTPLLAGKQVFATIVSEVKGDKIEVFKYKSKSRYRKHTGHRQQYTQVKIVGIGTKPKVSAEKKIVTKKAPAKKAVVKKPAK